MKKTRLTLFTLLLSMVLLAGCGSASNNNGNELGNAENNKEKTKKTSKTEKSEQVGVSQAAPAAGTVWSYTQHLFYETGSLDVKTYFVFKSDNEILWLFGTPKGHMFPVGYGNFNTSTGQMSFLASNPLHKNISIYYGHDAIAFSVDLGKMTAKLETDHEWLNDFYNGRQAFSLTKENYTMRIREDLVGSRWLIHDDEYGDNYYSFVSWNEVVFDKSNGNSKRCPYVELDNMVSIKIDDNLSDENIIGIYNGGDNMTLCVDGLNPEYEGCVTLRRVN